MAAKRYGDFEKISNFLDVKYVEYGFFCGDEWKYKNLRAPYTRLYIVLEGEAVIELGEENKIIEKGHAYIVPSNMNFSCYTPKYLKKLYVHFKCEQLLHKSLFDEVFQVLQLPIPTNIYDHYYHILEEERRSEYWEVKGEITNLIYRFIQKLDTDLIQDKLAKVSPEIYELHKRLKNELSAKTRISDLADMMKMSQSMLSKFYKASTGMSLKCFMQLQLMERAQLSLLETSKSIKEIASELQYEDALYFSRVFAKWIGESPTSYRERNKI